MRRMDGLDVWFQYNTDLVPGYITDSFNVKRFQTQEAPNLGLLTWSSGEQACASEGLRGSLRRGIQAP